MELLFAGTVAGCLAMLSATPAHAATNSLTSAAYANLQVYYAPDQVTWLESDADCSFQGVCSTTSSSTTVSTVTLYVDSEYSEYTIDGTNNGYLARQSGNTLNWDYHGTSNDRRWIAGGHTAQTTASGYDPSFNPFDAYSGTVDWNVPEE